MKKSGHPRIGSFGMRSVKLLVFAAAIFFIQTTVNAQNVKPTPREQQCFNMVQGKVAWNQDGDTTWNPAALRQLCQGTINPSATISCFQNEIRAGKDYARAIQACKAKSVTPLISEDQTVSRKVTFKNNANIQAILSVGSSSTGQLNIGESKTVDIKESIGTPLQIEVTMRLLNPDNFVIYRGTISGDNRATSFCFEAKGDVGKPSVQPCDGTQATEARKVEFRNEAGFIAKATLNYFVNGSPKSISTDDTSLGINRVLYIPTDADKNRDIKLSVSEITIAGRFPLNEIKIDPSSGLSPCYKVWGRQDAPKINPCSLSNSARTIKFKNMGAFVAGLEVVYYDQNQQRQTIQSNKTNSLEEDVMEIPRGISSKPIEVNFSAVQITRQTKDFYTTTIPANFTGEVCFKAEGTVGNPNASTCDDELNVTRDTDSRQIIFKNEAGYDAQIFVQYFEMQDIGGTKVAMPKSVASGFINLGKSRIITIPKATAPNMPITIMLQGNATLKNDIWSTTLPWDFKSSPVPCFKTWDTLFTPKGGTCN